MEKLTVFILTTGEESLSKCVDAIKNQSINDKHVSVEIDTIKDVYPMSEAFNEMHRRCKTPFFVQVDADIILKENALERLYFSMKDQSLRTYAVAGQLYEDGFGVGGAVRCWRTKFLNIFPFKDRRTVDRNLHNRVKWFGFKRHHIKEILGTHYPRHSEFTEYLKTKADVEKWRFLGRPFEKYAGPLLDELYKNPNENKLKIFGFFLGCMTGYERVHKSKNTNLESQRLKSILNSSGLDDLSNLSFNSEKFHENKENLKSLAKESYHDGLENRTNLLEDLSSVFYLPIKDKFSLLKEIER